MISWKCTIKQACGQQKSVVNIFLHINKMNQSSISLALSEKVNEISTTKGFKKYKEENYKNKRFHIKKYPSIRK